MLPTMQTDITLSTDDRVLIIDAKFYAHSTMSQCGTQSLISGNLYAKTDDDIIADNKAYSMSRNTIAIRSLDLEQSFSEISKQLNAIVNDYFG